MTDEELHRRLKKILMEACRVKEELIRPDATLQEDLALDSLDAVELIFSLDEEFGIKVSDQDMASITTLAGAVEMIKRLLIEKEEAPADAGQDLYKSHILPR